MSASLNLSIRCVDKETAKRLEAVLTPDNVDTPRGMRLLMRRKHDTVRFEIASEGVSSMATAIALLGDIALFEEVSLLSSGKRPGV